MKYLLENITCKKKIDCIIMPIFKNYIIPEDTQIINNLTNNYIINFIKKNHFQGKLNNLITLYNINVPNLIINKIIIVGCGTQEKINRMRFHNIINNIIIYIKKLYIKECMWLLVNLKIPKYNIYWNIRDTINIIENNLYCLNTFKKNKNSYNIQKLLFHVNDIYDNNCIIAIKHAMAINQGILKAKNLANLPPNICNPQYLVKQVYKLSEEFPESITIDIIDEKSMNILNMNAYLAVSKGSKNQALMSIIHYNNTNCNTTPPIVLIGKGLTFDSGGLSLKPSHNMHEMKYDMCGAASIYGIMYTIAKLKLPLHVIGLMLGCENMPDGDAIRPGDIIKTMSGITVEIKNTDAEGRLVLCDALTYVNRFNPKYVIDIATLTGACVIALGHNISGLMSNSHTLSKQIQQASSETNDRVWKLPINDINYFNQLYSNIADISNIGNNNAGSAITAACFLAKFAKPYKWAHIDIAGTAWTYDEHNQAIASGRPVNLICQLLLNNIS
ncbi:leucyl aminopeptidase [Enterobacteriaceae endosymbiont of Neohaemonia nigricornis]|uniref:leucyl aminopeptidase n=1 Tax=Enterobacteriaceae endosymbiont of Neohaemonia nigricornis TaxID=2675792 RepID=UPI0014491176|nr:leucyl aminopeptidase [Enterobacteriaceae endosymbiont of Neohaemonia nigricornis]QJC30350.1 leucyl aminopeptidase [Enterobacteriaceae endosymbiont of Neohaemonia nigricornis]